jgi:hypothetical protein
MTMTMNDGVTMAMTAAMAIVMAIGDSADVDGDGCAPLLEAVEVHSTIILKIQWDRELAALKSVAPTRRLASPAAMIANTCSSDITMSSFAPRRTTPFGPAYSEQ